MVNKTKINDASGNNGMAIYIEAEPCTGDAFTPWGTRSEAFYRYDDEESYLKGEWSEFHIHEYDVNGDWLGETIMLNPENTGNK